MPLFDWLKDHDLPNWFTFIFSLSVLRSMT